MVLNNITALEFILLEESAKIFDKKIIYFLVTLSILGAFDVQSGILRLNRLTFFLHYLGNLNC